MTAAAFADPWRFQPNIEVYVLVGFLIGAYVYTVRVLGPRAVPPGEQPASRRNQWCFVAGMVVMFGASTWPVHQIGEDYLYSVHMVQHMLLSYVLPPLLLLATPEWLLRVVIGTGRGYRVVAFFTRPVTAAVIYNLVIMLLHVPDVVNNAANSAPLHYSLHVLVVSTSLLMWAPIVGPFRELQMKPGGKIVYLFLLGVVPTLPAMWLSLADKPVYSRYGDQPVRVWGLGPMEDQQAAGLIMKLGGNVYMAILIIVIYATQFARTDRDENTYRRRSKSITN